MRSFQHPDRRAFLGLAGAGLAWPALAQDAGFANWVNAFRAEAKTKGIADAVLDDAFRGVAPIPRVIELDRKQPEFTLTFPEYLGRVVNDVRVEKGRQLAAENAKLLQDVSGRYGVPAEIVVALWGIESDFGRLTGGFNVIAALATLAYEGRRATFFRGELINALKIMQSEKMPAASMLGSWAGAMGQCQFMPSSFNAYAVDFNGDGRRDIWTTLPDVLGSAANYLAKSGWKQAEPWGDPVTIVRGIDPAEADLKKKRPLSAWSEAGIVPRNGGFRNPPESQTALLLPDGIAGQAFVVYRNFEVILRWNRSNFFALAVGTLADRIARA